MIKLTTKDEEPYWVNPALVASVFPEDGGARVCFIFPDDTITVKESPVDIIHAIEKHEFKKIRYKEKLARLAYGYSGGKEPVTTSLDSKRPAELDFDAKGEVRRP